MKIIKLLFSLVINIIQLTVLACLPLSADDHRLALGVAEEITHNRFHKRQNRFRLNGNSNGYTSCRQFLCRRQWLNGTMSLNTGDASSGYSNSDIPKCSDLMLEELHIFSSLLTRLNIKHYLIFGSLLGSIQSREIFGWTPDLDVAMPESSMRKLIFHQREIELEGFKLFLGGERLARACATDDVGRFDGSWPTARKSLRNLWQFVSQFPYIDIYLEYQGDHSAININPSEARLTAGMIYPLVDCKIGRYVFPCPRKSRAILSLHYGDDYMVPKQI
jgi:hypothetical protein